MNNFPNGEQYTKTFNDKEANDDSMLNESVLPLKTKLFTTANDSRVRLDKSAFGSAKHYFGNSLTASNISIPGAKSQQNSQFFGPRNNKTKNGGELVKNQKHIEPQEKLTQGVNNDKRVLKQQAGIQPTFSGEKRKSSLYTSGCKQKVNRVNNFLICNQEANLTAYDPQVKVPKAAVTTYGTVNVRNTSSVSGRWK